VPASASMRMHPGFASASMVSQKIHDATRAAIRATRQEGNTLKGLRLARRMVVLAQQENSAPAELEALNFLAICQAANGDYMEAIAASIDAFDKAKKLQDQLGMAHALTTLAGAASFILDTLDVSLLMLDECLKFALILNNVALEARVRALRGLVLGSLERFDESEAEFERTMQLIPFAGANTPRALVIGNHAHLAVKRARAAPASEQLPLWQRAQTQSDAALAVARTDGNHISESLLHFSRGELNRRLGKYDVALTEYREVMRFAKAAKQGMRIAETHFEIAHIYALRDSNEAALAEYQAALHVAESHRPMRLISPIYMAMAKLQRKLGHINQVAALQKKAEEEKTVFLRESEHTRRALNEFWRGLSAMPKQAAMVSTTATSAPLITPTVTPYATPTDTPFITPLQREHHR